MTSLLFICHGNICRSPMAEFVMKDIIHDRHADDFFHVESAAATTEELGHDIYPPVKKLLSAKDIYFEPRKARLFTAKDYVAFDYILAMDYENLQDLYHLTGNDPKEKISLLLSWCGEREEIADPWYTRDFETAYEDIRRSCTALFDTLYPKTQR